MNYLLFASQAYSISILRPLQKKILERGDKVAWFLHKINPNFLKQTDILLTTTTEVKSFNPVAVFVPGNWVPDFFPGIKVEVFHGFGIEKKGHFRIRGFFDLYCTHGPVTTETLEASANKNGYFKVIETGWPKMDPLFENKTTHIDITFDNNKKTILYAPTFSPSLTSAVKLFEQISKISKTHKYNWIIKFHGKMDAKTISLYEKIVCKTLLISTSQDILPLLNSADIMLTDSSSVISEFLLLDKPVITYRNRSPEHHTLNFTEEALLQKMIYLSINEPEKTLQNGRRYINKMHPYRDGKSSVRVLQAVDTFLIKHHKKLKSKPLNLIRRLQCRLRLSYFKIK